MEGPAVRDICPLSLIGGNPTICQEERCRFSDPDGFCFLSLLLEALYELVEKNLELIERKIKYGELEL